VDVVGVLGEIGPTLLAGESRDEAIVQIHGSGDERQVVWIPTEEIDPQELTLFQLACLPGERLDLAIEAVGVVQPGVDPVPLLVAQRTIASRVTTTIAMIAVPY
jgi:hypothetical protein